MIFLGITLLLILIYPNINRFNTWIVKVDPKIIEFYKAVGTFLVAVIAAGIASAIQWRQAKTAEAQALISKRKFNFELFEKRFPIYQASKQIIDKIRFAENVTNCKIEFRKEVSEAEILFDIEIHHYLMLDLLEEAGDRAEEIRLLSEKNSLSLEHREKLKEYNKWGGEQHLKIINIFRPYFLLDQP